MSRFTPCFLSVAVTLSTPAFGDDAATSAAAAACAEGLVDCAGVCRSLVSDVGNCGVCGKQCATGAECRAGVCTERRAKNAWISPLRMGGAVSAGYSTTLQTPIAERPAGERPDAGYDGRLSSGGVGIDIRIGVQLTRWLALDAQLFGQSIIFVGDARVGALLELSPIRALAFSFGGGYGGMYRWMLYQSNPTASFAVWVARVEGRYAMVQPNEPPLEVTFGVEGIAGRTLGSSLQQVTGARYVPEGSEVLGVRIFAGFLFR